MKLFAVLYLIAACAVLVLGMKKQVSEIRDLDLTTDLNLQWFQLQPKWYFPLLSPFKIWKFCVDAHGPSFCKKHSEVQIMGLGCTYWTPPTNTSIFGTFLKYDTVMAAGEILWRKQETFGAFRHFRFAYTDNQSFVLGLNEWEGGELCWMVISTIKSLPEATVEKISSFIKAFGYLEEAILINSPDNCIETQDVEGFGSDGPYKVAY